tara:strand:- start:3173 stop:3520 length:348 start_codon:yes stop_codon:yes gene_type:complete
MCLLPLLSPISLFLVASFPPHNLPPLARLVREERGGDDWYALVQCDEDVPLRLHYLLYSAHDNTIEDCVWAEGDLQEVAERAAVLAEVRQWYRRVCNRDLACTAPSLLDCIAWRM